MHNFTHVEHTSEEGQQYIFWCYSDMPGMLDILFRRVYGFALTLNRACLTYKQEERSVSILLNDIQDVSLQEGGAWPDIWPDVIVTLKTGFRVHFFLINPLEPNAPLASTGEATALIEILRALRRKSNVEFDPNPYHRELIRQGRVADIAKRYWDPYVSPWVYYAQDHPHFHSPLLMVLLAIIPGLILIAIGLILNYLQ